jgi:hypothetical protein
MPYEMARQQRHENHQPEAVGPDRHHHAVKQDDLPECRDESAGQEPQDQQAAAEQ